MIVKKNEINAMYEIPEMQIIELVMIDVITASYDPFPGEDEVFG